MSTQLNWKENKLTPTSSETVVSNEHTQIEYSATLIESSNSFIEFALKECIEKAVACLPDNLVDNSRYFLFEWDVTKSALTIVVTDDSKKKDSKYRVKCSMQAMNDEITKIELDTEKQEKVDEYSDFIKYFAQDYLTTCGGFMQFSLVAVFHRHTRAKTELL